MNLSQVVVLCASFLFTGSLLMMHRYFLWWPLHPIGYILGSSVPMPTLWFPLFLSFLLKWGNPEIWGDTDVSAGGAVLHWFDFGSIHSWLWLEPPRHPPAGTDLRRFLTESRPWKV